MRFAMTIVLTALLTYASGLYLPWWSATISALLVAAFVVQRVDIAAVSGFLGVFLLWLMMAWGMSRANGDILAHRMSLFIIKKDSPGLLILITALIGGLAGMLGALTGSLARRAFKPVP
jgi:hypothetical protein